MMMMMMATLMIAAFAVSWTAYIYAPLVHVRLMMRMQLRSSLNSNIAVCDASVSLPRLDPWRSLGPSWTLVACVLAWHKCSWNKAERRASRAMISCRCAAFLLPMAVVVLAFGLQRLSSRYQWFARMSRPGLLVVV